MKFTVLITLILGLLSAGCSTPDYDIIIRNGTLFDGTGTAGQLTDIAINADTIAFVGDLDGASAQKDFNADGLVVSPGFINVLSWATESLFEDGRSQSDIRQGVTLEVFGEGWSEGPLTDEMRQDILNDQGAIKYEMPWHSLGEYLQHLEKRGISPNVASFVGATTIRINVLGHEDRAPNEVELEKMKDLVRTAMAEGALGVGSSLIYAPAFYADTDELIALCSVAAEYDGLYISHMRSEGNRLLESIDEVIQIANNSGIRAEIYHLKAAGIENHYKMPLAIAKIDSARAAGVQLTADMYTYPAGATGLDAAMPPWVQEGGNAAWFKRLEDPEIRKKVASEMRTPTDEWENLMLASGAEGMILVGFQNEVLKPLTGRTLADVAAERGLTPEETAIDLVIEDQSRVGTIYFLMSAENVALKVAQPWVSFGSDAESKATEGVFLTYGSHPRAYGNFARLLGKYVRDEQVITLAEAIRKLTSLPAENLRIKKRGQLQVGYFADIAVFDPATIQDHATFEDPHQYSTGMIHVFVNGTQVLSAGEHTGALPGRAVYGPGKKE